MHGPLNSVEHDRLLTIPVINRARGHRLYCVDGSRWIDCWADGGRALLGHRPGKVSLRLKNEIDKGLYAPYPSLWNHRLEQALHRLFPGYGAMRVFSNFDRALEKTAKDQWPVDPLDISPETANLDGPAWGRPLLPNHPLSRILFPILPVPGIDIQPVLFGNASDSLPPSDPVSPILLAALTRSCLAVSSTDACSTESIKPWEMRGPYMLWRGKEDDYTQWFDALFERSVLIAPAYNRPSVLPPDLSPGERMKVFMTDAI